MQYLNDRIIDEDRFDADDDVETPSDEEIMLTYYDDMEDWNEE